MVGECGKGGMVPPVCNTMRPYNIKPLDFSANEACKTVSSVIRILPEKDGWNVWVDGCTWGGPYPTFEAAVEAANEIHRKVVERFLEPAQVSVEPIGEKHRDGNPYLTDVGWARYITREEAIEWCVTRDWYLCDESTRMLLLEGVQPYAPSTPTLVITILP